MQFVPICTICVEESVCMPSLTISKTEYIPGAENKCDGLTSVLTLSVPEAGSPKSHEYNRLSPTLEFVKVSIMVPPQPEVKFASKQFVPIVITCVSKAHSAPMFTKCVT